jgi:hypothetical protein
MTKVFIKLDLSVVQEAIKAKVPAAVEDVLRRYDLQRLIETAITSDKTPEIPTTHDKPMLEPTIWSLISPSLSSPRSIFEQSMNSAIAEALDEAATKYLQSHPEILQPALDRAIPKALAKLKFRIEEDDNDDD